MVPQEEKKDSTINAQPDKITPRHRALMRRLVAGMTVGDACNDIGFSISRASVIINSPLFQEEMKRMEADVNKDFAEAEGDKASDATRVLLSESSEDAAKTLKASLSDENANVRISVAKDILDRTGYSREDKIKAKVLVEPSQSLIDLLGRIAKEKHVDTGNDTE